MAKKSLKKKVPGAERWGVDSNQNVGSKGIGIRWEQPPVGGVNGPVTHPKGK